MTSRFLPGALAGGCLAVLALLAVAGPGWAPNETQISAQRDIVDPEYNQARAQFVWSDAQGRLWIGNIDRDSGLFYPPDGKAVLVDPESLGPTDVLKTGNGPEWVWAAGGDAIVYTKFAGRAHSEDNARIGYARPLPDGTWSAGFLGPSVARKGPYGSETENDPSPRITYADKFNNHYWREIADPASEQLLPGTQQAAGPVRHVRGARAVIYQSPAADGVLQVFRRELDTGAVEQLTFDAGDKDQPWMWRAPEFGNAFVFMTVVDHVELRAYRQPGPGAAWTPFYSARAPRKMQIISPEPFVWAGASYMHLAMAVGRNTFSSEIWISNLDPAAPVFRRISDNTLLRARVDPEVFVTSSGPYIYYSRLTLAADGKYCAATKCSEGIFRAEPGLR